MLSRFLCLFAAVPLLAQDPAGAARRALDLFVGGKYADLFPMFTPEMQKSYPETELVKLGAQLKSYGALSKIDEPTVQKSGSNTIAVFPAHFEKQNINFRYIINQAGQVAAMFMLPGEVPWTRPAYSKPDAFRESEVTVGADQWKLPGTLTVPTGSGPFTGIVLV